ncbi:DUF305 domain-containing protein [Streptomyces milbemycinicus]|uniref:DUF305 domain-containing protein n=1 Tax=Streptomyces milbemycinicus TaxID=476552 RepID=A0ABW8LRW6_9ACTN
MHAMERTSGKAFDTTFLTMMIEHHEGAVQMARTEKSKVSTAPPRHSPTASSPLRRLKSSRCARCSERADALVRGRRLIDTPALPACAGDRPATSRSVPLPHRGRRVQQPETVRPCAAVRVVGP